MPHFIEFARSFVENIGNFGPPAEEEIAAVVRGLEDDPAYTPASGEYVFERDASGFCVCWHTDHWGDWVLTWYPEIGFSSTIRVWVGLDQREDASPVKLVPVPPRSNVSW